VHVGRLFGNPVTVDVAVGVREPELHRSPWFCTRDRRAPAGARGARGAPASRLLSMDVNAARGRGSAEGNCPEGFAGQRAQDSQPTRPQAVAGKKCGASRS
jgi:hypothetical protein